MVLWYHYIGDFANVFKSFVGTNYLACAYGFKISGLGFGILGLLWVGFLTDYCCLLLVRCKQCLIDTILDDHEKSVTQNSDKPSKQPSSRTSSTSSHNGDGAHDGESRYRHQLSDATSDDDNTSLAWDLEELRESLSVHIDYADLGRQTIGDWAATCINFCLAVTQIGFCVGYFIFVGNTLHSLLPEIPIYNISACGNVSEDQFYPTASPHHVVARSLNVSQENQSALLEFTSTWSTPSDHDDIESTSESTTESIQTTSSLVSPTNATHNQTEIPPCFTYIGPSLVIMVLLPLPVIIAFTLFRSVRQLSIISVVANTCIVVGFFSVLIYLIIDFNLTNEYSWFITSTVLVYISQVTAGYEAIGTILPIQSSMRGNRHNFSPYLHASVVLLTCMIGLLALLGYLHYGPDTDQIIVTNLPKGTPITIIIKAVLILGVLCTYPLQVFPVIQIMETMCFGTKTMHRSEGGSSYEPLLASDFDFPRLIRVPTEVPLWKRYTLRIILPVCICGVAIGLRNVFAYVGAFVGALGSTPLMFVIPPFIYLKLNAGNLSLGAQVKNILLIVYGLCMCVVGVLLTVVEIVRKA